MSVIDNVIRRWGNDNSRVKNQWSGYVGLIPIELYNLMRENHLMYADQSEIKEITIFKCELTVWSAMIRVSYDEIKEIGVENVHQYLFDKIEEYLIGQMSDEARIERLCEEKALKAQMSVQRAAQRRDEEVIVGNDRLVLEAAQRGRWIDNIRSSGEDEENDSDGMTSYPGPR